jgi:cholesterol transport system auxiliary component
MRYFLIGCLMFFSVGCGNVAKQPVLHDFGLVEVGVTDQGKACGSQVVAGSCVPAGKLSVNVNAPTWLWDSRIRYRLLFASPSQIRFYGLDRWIASPPEMLEQLLSSCCMAQDITVRIQLQDFEQQFDAPDRARVVMRFSVGAYSVDNIKISAQEFYLQQPSKTPDAAGAIKGFAGLAQQSADRIRDWLERLVQQRSTQK